MVDRCEHGTAKAGSASDDRCEKEATKEYLGLGKDNPLNLCEEHYKDYHYSDFLSSRR